MSEVVVRAFPAGDVDDAAAYIRIRNAVSPDDATSFEDMRWEDATFPGQGARLVAELDGEPVGAATVGRLHIHGSEHPRWYVGLWVPEGRRRRGVGSALFRAASHAARVAGKTGFQTWVSEASVDGVAFLAGRDFLVVSRDKTVVLGLHGRDVPDPGPPSGFVLETLAGRPELVAGVHATAVEAFPDIPTPGEPLDVGTLEAFAARDVDRAGMPKDAFFVAVDSATGEVAGYASLKLGTGSLSFAYHDMTAVRPRYRGRGVASALKRATIAWAIDHGLEELRTGNDEDNAPMRAVNAALGYRPGPDYLCMQGPLAPA